MGYRQTSPCLSATVKKTAMGRFWDEKKQRAEIVIEL
jgi:hypothetical protein